VSYTSNANFECFVDDTFDLTTGRSRRSKGTSSNRVNGTDSLVFFTQRVIKRQPPPGGRTSTGSFSCLTYVPSFLCGYYWPLISVNSQTELAINTHVAVVNTRTLVSDVHHDVVNTHTLVSDVHHGVLDTHAIVSDIHRNILKSQEGTDSQHRSVSVARSLSPRIHLQLDRLKIGQRSRFLLGSASYACI